MHAAHTVLPATSFVFVQMWEWQWTAAAMGRPLGPRTRGILCESMVGDMILFILHACVLEHMGVAMCA